MAEVQNRIRCPQRSCVSGRLISYDAYNTGLNELGECPECEGTGWQSASVPASLAPPLSLSEQNDRLHEQVRRLQTKLDETHRVFLIQRKRADYAEEQGRAQLREIARLEGIINKHTLSPT